MKRFIVLLFCGLATLYHEKSECQTIIKIAGNSTTPGFSGDGGAATAAELNSVVDVAVDQLGNVYIADSYNNRIRKVNTSGIISTYAGGSPGGWAGDGGPATAAQFNWTYSVAVDTAGELFITDYNNLYIRKINTAGIVSDYAGHYGGLGYSGDGGAATAATLRIPRHIRASHGNLYIADYQNSVVRKVDASGTITTVAGNGTLGNSGDGGAATSAELGFPIGVAVDHNGNLYIADVFYMVIRKVNTSGIISTIAGNGIAGFSPDGTLATAGSINYPVEMAVDTAGNIYFSEMSSNRIRKINSAGVLSTVAGTGIAGSSGDGGPATAAELNAPHGLVLDAAGNLYFADNGLCIRKIILAPTATTGLQQPVPNSNARIALWPNPSGKTVNIEYPLNFTANKTVSLYVLNLNGDVVMSEKFFCGEELCTSLDVSYIPEGTYLIQINSTDEQATAKLVIKR